MFRPRTGISPDLSSVAIINFISSLYCPTCFKHFLDLSLFPPPPDLLLPPPHLSPCNAVPISLFHPLLPPNSPGRGAFVHMDVAPTLQPTPLVISLTSLAVIDLLPRSLPYPGFPCRVPVNVMFLVRLHPLCCPQPAPRSLSAPRGFPFQGYLLPSSFLHLPHV